MQNAESNPTRNSSGNRSRSPGEDAGGRRHADAATQAAQVAQRPLTPEIAGKMPTGLPPIERGTQAPDSGDPVRRAAARIPTLDNANMAMTDNTVDVDGRAWKPPRARRSGTTT